LSIYYTAPATKLPYCYYEHSGDLKSFEFISLDNIDTTSEPRILRGIEALYFATVMTQSLERNPYAKEEDVRNFQERLFENIQNGLLENTIKSFQVDQKRAERKNVFLTSKSDVSNSDFGEKVLEREREYGPSRSDELEKERELQKQKELEEERELRKQKELEEKKARQQRHFRVTRTDMNALSPDEQLTKKERIILQERERIQKMREARGRDFGRER